MDAAGRKDETRYHEIEYSSVGAFDARLPAGRYVVAFHREHPPTESLTVTVVQGETTRAEIRMR